MNLGFIVKVLDLPIADLSRMTQSGIGAPRDTRNRRYLPRPNFDRCSTASASWNMPEAIPLCGLSVSPSNQIDSC